MQPRVLRKELETKRQQLSGKIFSSMETTRGQQNGREVFKDPYGNAALTLDDEITAAVVERRAQILDELNSALDDIDRGRYGICRDCGEPIAKQRLKVLPFATRCIGCQTALENSRRAA
jgi:RNA polymerase-binding protein DksA